MRSPTMAICFPACTASLLAGERRRQPRRDPAPIHRYEKVIGTVDERPSPPDLSAILVVLAIGLVSIIVLRSCRHSATSAGFNAELPLSTRIILGVSDFAQQQFLLLSAAIVVGSAAFAAWIRQPGQRAQFDRALLTIPFIGQTARKFVTAQMARTLSTLLGGGIPLVNSLEVTARSVSNHTWRKSWTW
jgi:type II secretory pathway component PulF